MPVRRGFYENWRKTARSMDLGLDIIGRVTVMKEHEEVIKSKEHIHGNRDEHGYEHPHGHEYSRDHEHSHGHEHSRDHDHEYFCDHGHNHDHAHAHPNAKAVSNRLARAIGHLEAVKRMVDRGEDCSQILIQLAAVRSAINNAGKVILMDHLNHCIVDAVEDGDLEKIEEFSEAIQRFVK